ncbi:MAG: hypothetical protein HC836_46210 [Richelia sp. RM2_1_2]|nr:hypothetical protein [Richelia sp. RM2_1_2]
MPRKKSETPNETKSKVTGIGSVGLPRMSDGELQKVSRETREQKNYQTARILRNDVKIEKRKADTSDLKVLREDEKYKQADFQLQAETIQTDIEQVKVEIKGIELVGVKNTKALTQKKVELELERGKEALQSLSLDIDRLKGQNRDKQRDIELMEVEIVDRVGDIKVEDIKQRLLGA